MEAIAVGKAQYVKKRAMPLCSSEVDKLASLHGKAKKAYLKELKEKYKDCLDG